MGLLLWLFYVLVMLIFLLKVMCLFIISSLWWVWLLMWFRLYYLSGWKYLKCMLLVCSVFIVEDFMWVELV